MPQRKRDGGPALTDYRRTRAKLKAGRITVELSNTAKVLFPGDGITKGDLVAYYQRAGGPWAGMARRRPGLARAHQSLRRLAA